MFKPLSVISSHPLIHTSIHPTIYQSTFLQTSALAFILPQKILLGLKSDWHSEPLPLVNCHLSSFSALDYPAQLRSSSEILLSHLSLLHSTILMTLSARLFIRNNISKAVYRFALSFFPQFLSLFISSSVSPALSRGTLVMLLTFFCALTVWGVCTTKNIHLQLALSLKISFFLEKKGNTCQWD